MNAKYILFEKKMKTIMAEEQLDNQLTPDEVLVKSEASVISTGTETASLMGIEEGVEFPYRPGYGCVGRVEAMGSSVIGFEIGDRVYYAGNHASLQKFEQGQNHQWNYLFKVPEEIDAIDAAMGCMVNIAMTAPNATSLKFGDTVAVFGLGLVGTIAALLYQLQGVRVIGFDPISSRCELAKELGLREAYDVPVAEQMEKIMTLTGDEGADVIVDAVGHSAVIGTCVKAAKPMGQILLLGSPRVSVKGDLTEAFWDIHLNSKKLIGSHLFQYPVKEDRGVPMHVEKVYQASFDLMKTGQLNLRPMISHVVKPDEAAAIYSKLIDEKETHTCVVIDWRDEEA